MATRRSSVRVEHRVVSKWLPRTESVLDRAVLEMATDIQRQASLLAPKATGALKKSGRIERKGNADYVVTYGNSSVPYARRRHFENQKSPSTLRYLEKAGDSVARGSIKKYLRNK